MANIIHIVIVVKNVSIKEIVDRYTSDEFLLDFNKIIPMPDDVYMGDLTPEIELEYPNNWYTWATEHWGTHSHANACTIAMSGKDVVLEFYTLSTPCFPIIKQISEDFKTTIKVSYKSEFDKKSKVITIRSF